MLKEEGGKGMHKMKMCQCKINAFPFFQNYRNTVFIVQNYNKFISTASASTTP